MREALIALLRVLPLCLVGCATASPRPFFAAPIGDDVARNMVGKTWHEGCPVLVQDLRALHVVHHGFDGIDHAGVLIVHRDVADDVLSIFQELHRARFPIEKIRPVDDYGGDDARSMADNNTSGFNCRANTSQPTKFSLHAYGRAIDINPLQNPYASPRPESLHPLHGPGGAPVRVEPPGGLDYLDRRQQPRPGMILEYGVAHRAFVARGWTWGGSWSSVVDYQHFEHSLH